MLTLHDYQPSLNGWKVRVLLGLLGIPYRIREVALFQGESRSEAFLRLNPVGAIPVLELEDGRSIAETNAILMYLADGTRFLPGERYACAKVAQWLSFEQYYIEPTIGSLRFWTLTGRLGLNAGRMIESRRENGERALAALERTLNSASFLVGDELTIADIAVYAYTHRAEDCGFSFAPHAALSAWLGRVATAIGPGHPIVPYTADAQLA
jgi:glutathione S-transferase